MDTKQIWTDTAQALREIPMAELLLIAVLAMVIGWLGSALARRRLPMGRFMSGVSTFALAGVLLTVVLQSSQLDRRLDVALTGSYAPEETVAGGETRIPLAPDGHFWINATINGVEGDFLVDTGATFTAVSAPLAAEAGLDARRGGMPVQINTANGAIGAQMVGIDTMQFGNIEARGLDAVTSPAFGDTNVVGMNLLSKLGGWRVEGETLILTPASE